MKNIFCILLCLVLMGTLLTGCRDNNEAPAELPLDEAAAKIQIEQHLNNEMLALQEHFNLEDARLTILNIYLRQIVPRTATSDGDLSCSIHYELQIPSVSEDLMERAAQRELCWRDVALGLEITEYLSLDQFTLEGYTFNKPTVRCDGIRTGNDELLRFTIDGDEDYGCGTIGISSNFTETGAYDYDWLYYSNPNMSADYYSKAEYEQNATPASVSLCPACRGAGYVRQYATNSWWDEGYVAECALCN